MLFKSTAPGSMMLCGEYAVLHGKTALVTAINKTLTVAINPRKDNVITIQSCLGNYQTTKSNLTLKKPFQFVLSALKQISLPSGCDISIVSEINPLMGLGSSAAVTIATLGAINAWLECNNHSHHQLWQLAKKSIHAVQGGGSGADLAASLWGGIVAIKTSPLTIQTFAESLPLSVIYSGNKLPTADAIQSISARNTDDNKFFTELYQRLDALSLQAIPAIKMQNLQQLGVIFNSAQGCMQQLGVSNAMIDSLIATLRQQPQVYGAKISGSGLGDCVIAVGALKKNIFPRNRNDAEMGVLQLNIAITSRGMTVDSTL